MEVTASRLCEKVVKSKSCPLLSAIAVFSLGLLKEFAIDQKPDGLDIFYNSFGITLGIFIYEF